MTTESNDHSEAEPPAAAVPPPVASLLQAFRTRFSSTSDVQVARAPGRVNLIGDHTDYNDGFVLPMTLGQAVYFALRKRPDDHVRLYSLNYDEVFSSRLGALPGRGTSWQHYVAGVIQALQERGVELSGFEGAIYGEVPVGSGLSSSAALEVATLVSLQELFAFEMDGVEAAKLCQQVEHQFVGVECGIMDQFASRLGRAGHALFLDCRTLGFQEIPVDLDGHCLVVVDSTVSRGLADSKYNERRRECEEGVAFFSTHDPGVHALRDVTATHFEAHAGALPDTLRRRCRHVVRENERVLEAKAALQAGDLARFGALMNDSHASLRDDYEVSCPELDVLVETAQATGGVLGARMTGAGFGGCTVSLVRQAAVPTLERRLDAACRDAFGLRPNVYVVEQNVAAGPVSL